MSLIKAYKKVDPGEYEATIVDLKDIATPGEKTLRVDFELEEGGIVTGSFPFEATGTNQTTKLIEAALGEYRTCETEDLIGQTVKVLVDHGPFGGRPEVIDIIQ